MQRLINNDNKIEHERKLNRNLRDAMRNRFNNQSKSISSQDYYEANQLCSITNDEAIFINNTSDDNELFAVDTDNDDNSDNNYNTDEFGRRRGLRRRKKRVTFYDTYRAEQDQLDKAKASKTNTTTNNTTNNTSKRQKQSQPQYKQTKAQKKARKFNLTATKTNEIFKDLYSDLLYTHRIDSLLSPMKLRINQLNDPICSILINFVNGIIDKDSMQMRQMKKYYQFIYRLAIHDQFYLNSNNILCLKKDEIHQSNRIVVPSELIPVALTYIHKAEHFNHPGVNQTKRLIEAKFFWYGYPADTKKFISECTQCQLGKGNQRHILGKLQPLHAPEHNHTVHFDYLGPIHKQLSILVMVDNYTGYVMLVPAFSQSADEVIRALWNVWRPIHGIPKQLITDRGSGFIAEVNQKFYDLFKIRKLFTSSYHPETNAKAERVVQEVKKALRLVNVTLDGELTDKKQIKRAINEITMLLPSIQFSINQKLKTFSPVSPNMLLYGTNLNDTMDCTVAIDELNKMRDNKDYNKAFKFIDELNKQLKVVRSMHDYNYKKYVFVMKKNYDKNKMQSQFEIGDKVVYYIGKRAYTNLKLRPRFTGPFKVIKLIGDNACRILNEDTNETMVCHVKMLKKYNEEYFTPELVFQRTLKQKKKLDSISYRL